jgi:holin-like protein
MKAWMKGAVQVGFFVVFSIFMNQLVKVLHLNIPGSILGIAVLFLLLQTKVIKLEWIDMGAKWLLAEMLLFFIPPAVGIIQYQELIHSSGIRILIAVSASILAVMIAAGLMAERLAKRKEADSL